MKEKINPFFLKECLCHLRKIVTVNCLSTAVSFQLLNDGVFFSKEKTLVVLKKANAGQTITKMIATRVKSNKSTWEGDTEVS